MDLEDGDQPARGQVSIERGLERLSLRGVHGAAVGVDGFAEALELVDE